MKKNTILGNLESKMYKTTKRRYIYINNTPKFYANQLKLFLVNAQQDDNERTVRTDGERYTIILPVNGRNK